MGVMRDKDKYMTELDILGTKLALLDKLKTVKINTFPGIHPYNPKPISAFESLEGLLKRDETRKNDGFPKKIKFRTILAGPGRIISVPYVEEEKLIHGEFEPKSDSGEDGEEADEAGDLGETAGSGKGEVGDVIGEAPLHDGDGGGEDEGEDPQAGQGSGEHGFEQEAYEKGKELSEKLQLPNLRDKGKKVPTNEYIYDLTDRHRGSGQVLDKKETLKSIVKTNSILGRLDKDNVDTANFIVGPNDKVYRVLSKEKVWKSMAIVFFARDYSGSMWGEATKAVVTQHLMIYFWLLVQYDKLVIPRFFVHDTEAKEVTVKEYFGLMAGGGTSIPSVYKEITKAVEGESLAQNYNIYVFQGTDGDDWDYPPGEGREAIPEIEKILGYVNRMGVSVLKHPYYGDRETTFEQYVKKGNFIDRRDVFRMHIMSSVDVTDDDNIEAVKELIAQD